MGAMNRWIQNFVAGATKFCMRLTIGSWRASFRFFARIGTMNRLCSVAQTASLLYRRLPTCDTADCQSALRTGAGSWRALFSEQPLTHQSFEFTTFRERHGGCFTNGADVGLQLLHRRHPNHRHRNRAVFGRSSVAAGEPLRWAKSRPP